MSDSILIASLIAGLGILASALASGLETGIYVLNRVRLAVRVGQGDRNARRLRDELKDPSRTLSTLLVVNNIANYAGSLGIAAILTLYFTDPLWVVILNTLIVVPILFIFAETLPKDIFRTRADTLVYMMSGGLLLVRRVFTVCGLVPLVAGVGNLAARIVGGQRGLDLGPRARVAKLLRESVGSGGLTSHQASLTERVLAMDRLTVSSEMTPWRGVVSLSTSDGQSGLAVAARRTRRSRLPVVDLRGEVVGTIETMQTLLRPEAKIEDLIQSVPMISGDTPVLEALEMLRSERKPMAIVLGSDTSGVPVGLVTLKDLVEPLTGDLIAW